MRLCRQLAILGFPLLLTPLLGAAESDPDALDPPRLTASERRLTSAVARTIFATQAAERQEAAALGLTDLEEGLSELRADVEALAAAEARAEFTSTISHPSASIIADRDNKRARLDASLSRLSTRRAAIQAHLSAVKSDRQRAVALRALAKLEALDQAIRDATSAPAAQRVRGLAAMRARLVLERRSLSNPPRSGFISPTIQAIPEESSTSRQ